MRIELVLDRFFSNDKFSLGSIKQLWYTAGNQRLVQTFKCFTLEDAHHAQKIQGLTRVPAGKYEIVLYTQGTKYAKYLKQFGEWQKPGMLLLKNVPGYEGILIHPGNSAKDTEGCILVGRSSDEKNGLIGYSAEAYQKLYLELSKELRTGNKVFIEIQDNDI